MFDYLVIGGGSAGCVLAARLSEDPNMSVCLLEAGPANKNVLIHCPAGVALLARTNQANWAFETVPQPGLNGRRGYQPRGKAWPRTRSRTEEASAAALRRPTSRRTSTART